MHARKQISRGFWGTIKAAPLQVLPNRAPTNLLWFSGRRRGQGNLERREANRLQPETMRLT